MYISAETVIGQVGDLKYTLFMARNHHSEVVMDKKYILPRTQGQ